MKPIRLDIHLATVCLLVVVAGCAERSGPFAAVPMEWTAVPPPTGALPDGVRLESGTNHELPLRAWAVVVDPTADGVRVGVVASSDEDGRGTATELARQSNSCVLINGGFYWIDRTDRARHIGLLVRERVVLEAPLDRVVWQQVRYPTSRATVGADTTGRPIIRWVNARNDDIVIRERPFDNALGRPAVAPDSSSGTLWRPSWALSAGPAVVVDGQPLVTREQEAFFDAHIPRIHPRSAAGVTDDGRLILLVVDGRQPHSRGVSLEELAVILKDLGARWALNLDGGGSSTLVVNGELVNRPSGSDQEREIVSALSVTCP